MWMSWLDTEGYTAYLTLRYLNLQKTVNNYQFVFILSPCTTHTSPKDCKRERTQIEKAHEALRAPTPLLGVAITCCPTCPSIHCWVSEPKVFPHSISKFFLHPDKSDRFHSTPKKPKPTTTIFRNQHFQKFPVPCILTAVLK